jgi:hypothetical protein
VNARVACDLQLDVSARVPQGYAAMYEDVVCGASIRCPVGRFLRDLSTKESPAHTGKVDKLRDGHLQNASSRVQRCTRLLNTTVQRVYLILPAPLRKSSI